MADNEQKATLRTEVLLNDQGSIEAVFKDLTRLHAVLTSIDGLVKKASQNMQAGFTEAEGGIARETLKLSQELKNYAKVVKELETARTLSPNRPSSQNNQTNQGTLMAGAQASGQLDAVKQLSKAEADIYQARVQQNRVTAEQLRQEQDLYKIKLAQKAVEEQLRAMGDGGNAQMRARVLRQQAALEENISAIAKKQKDEADRVAREKQDAREAQADARRQAAKAATEMREKNERDARVLKGLESSQAVKDSKARVKTYAEGIQYQPQTVAYEKGKAKARLDSQNLSYARRMELSAAAKNVPTLDAIKKQTNADELIFQAKLSQFRMANEHYLEAEIRNELALKRAIQERIAELKKYGGSTEDQLRDIAQKTDAKVLSQSRYRLSSLTSGTLSTVFPQGISTASDLELKALQRGQEQRILRTATSGSISEKRDAEALLAVIQNIQETRRKAAAEAAAAARKQDAEDAKTDAEKAARARAQHQLELQYRNDHMLRTKAVSDMEATKDREKHKAIVNEVAARNLTLDQAKHLNKLEEVQLELLAQKIRFQRAGSEAEKQASLEVENALRRRQAELRQLSRRNEETPDERASRLAQTRANTTERLFGDGGAHLLTIQAGLMLNYAALNGLRSMMSGAIQTVLELDTSLRQLQAISATTSGQMLHLKQSVIDVSESTKFSAVEIANAAVTLAQAGFSTKQIEQALRGVALFAHATGTEIARAVDLTTSVLTVFDRDAGQSEAIANKMTLALNRSKLDVQKLQMGLQYAGNAAADSGVSFEELIGVLGSLANAGIRSGSTIGTGTRQLLMDLQKPSEEMLKIMNRLGLNMADIDIKSHGLMGVLENLKTHGFTTAEAFRAFQTRAAAAFSAITNNSDVFYKLQNDMYDVQAAAQASDVQMESLTIQLDRVKTNAGVLAEEAFSPLRAVVRDMAKAMANLTRMTGPAGDALRVVGTAIGSLVTGVAIAGVLRLAGGLISMATGAQTFAGAWAAVTGVFVSSQARMTAAQVALTAAQERNLVAQEALKIAQATTAASAEALAVAETEAALATSALTAAETAAAAATRTAALGWAARVPMLAGIVAAIGLAVSAFMSFSKEEEKLNDKVDETKTKFNEAKEVINSQASAMTAMEEAMGDLINKQSELVNGSQALQLANRQMKEQFGDLGLALRKGLLTPVTETIQALKDLRTELAQKMSLELENMRPLQAATLQAEREKTQASFDSMLSELEGRKHLIAKAPTKSIIPITEITQMQKKFGDVTPYTAEQIAKLQQQRGYIADQLNTAASRGVAQREDFQALAEWNTALGKVLLQATRFNSLTERLRQSDIDYQRESERLRGLGERQKTPEYQTAEAARNDIARLRVPTLGRENKGTFKDNPVAYESYYENVFKEDLQTLENRRKAIQAEVDSLENSTKLFASSDPRRIKALASIDNANAEMTEINKAIATVETEGARISELSAKAQKEELQLKIEQKTLKIKALEAEIQGEYGAERLKSLGEKLAQETATKAQLESKLHEVTAKTPLAKKLAAGNEAENTRQDLKIISERLSMRTAEVNKWWEGQGASENKQMFQQSFDAIDTEFKKLDRKINNKLGRSAAGIADGVAGLQDELRLASLSSAGYQAPPMGADATNGAKFDYTELSFRRQVAGQFQMAAIKRQLEAAKKAKAKQQASEISSVLPSLEFQAQAQLKTLEGLQASLENAMNHRMTSLDAARKKSTAGGSVPQAEKDAIELEKQQVDQMEAMYKTQEDRSNAQLEKIDQLKLKRQELEDTFTASEGKFSTVFAAIRTGIEGLTQGFSEFFQRIITSTGDTREAFEELGRGILASMLKVLSDKIAQQFMEMLLDSAGTLIRGGTGTPVTIPGMTETIQWHAKGGLVKGYAEGGIVPGVNIGRDSVPAMLMPNEFVMSAPATAALGTDFLTGLNQQTTASLRQGAARAGAAAPAMPPVGNQLVNVWVVTPDQKAGISKNDVVVTVEDNILQGKSIKRLIKQVQLGQV